MEWMSALIPDLDDGRCAQIVWTGAQWRMMPHDLPPWVAVYQQTQRWLKASVFEAIVVDLRAVLRMVHRRNEEPGKLAAGLL
jgi:transposase